MGFNSYCVETDGLTQYAKMGDVLDLEFGDGPLAFSIMVWFKTTDTGGYLVSKMDNTPTGYGLYVGASGQIHARLFSDATFQEELETLATGWNDDEWHQVVWTYEEPGSGAGSSLYIDGELRGVTVVSSNVLGQPTANTAELNFSGRNNGSDLLACRFTETAFYNKALNAVDVSRLYNGGNCMDLKALDSVKNTGILCFTITSTGNYTIRRKIETYSTWFDGNWHHVLAAKAGASATAMDIWVDGVLQAKNITFNGGTGWNDPGQSVVIGGQTETGITNFRGNLAEISMYDAALGTSDAVEIYNGGVPTDLTLLTSAPNLTNWWRLGNTTDTPPAATLNSILDIISTDAPGGVLTRSIRSDKAAFTLSLGNSFNWQRDQLFSLSCWFKTDASAIDQTILAKEDATRRGYLVFVTATGEIEWSLANTAAIRVSVRSTATFNDGNWHHLLVTYGGASLATSLNIYVDGAVQATTTILDALTADTNDDAALYFGSTARTSMTFRGLLAGFAMYVGELDAVEDAEIYNAGVPADPETLTTAGQLLGYWPAGEGYNPGTLVGMTQANLVNDCTFLFFNIMDDVPSQDPYGFFLFAVGNESKVLDQEKTTWKNGVGLDPDGVASNRSMLRSVPYDTNGTMTSVRSPATFIAEDPAWGKYYSEKIPIFCATAGRRGIRGTLSDIWWAPFNVTTGVCGHIDTSTKVCCMQCFWLPCPGDPWIL